MTGLRERIEAERAALLDERAIAEAAWDYADELTAAWTGVELSHETLIHAMRQDPTATIARIDRELARIDADLALLTSAEGFSALGGSLFQAFSESANRNLAARYPEF